MWRVVEGKMSSPAEQRNLHPATPRSSEHKVSSQYTSEMKPGLVRADNAGNLVEAANLDNISEGSEVKSVYSDSSSPYVDTKMTPNKIGNFEEQSFQTEKAIDVLDEYVDLVTSMIPARYPNTLGEVDHASVIDGYNSHLGKTQNHVSMWQYGKNIKSSIRQTHESARLFVPEFQRKYDIFQKKLKMISNSNLDLKKDDLLKDIGEIKGILQNSPSEGIVSYMEEQLLKTEKELNELSVAEGDLDEFITFLEFVKKDANIIKDRATVTGENIKHFKDLILKDQSSFNQSKSNAEQAINASVNRLNNVLDQIKEYKKKREIEEELRQHLAEERTKAEAQIEDCLQEKEDNTVFANKAKPTTCSFVNICILCIYHYFVSCYLIFNNFCSETIRPQSKPIVEVPPTYSERPRLNQEQLYESVSINLKKADLNQGRLDQITQQIYDLEDKTLKMKTDIEHLSFVKHHLETITEKTDRILPYINKFLENFNLMVKISDNNVLRLQSLITKAREAKDPVKKEV